MARSNRRWPVLSFVVLTAVLAGAARAQASNPPVAADDFAVTSLGTGVIINVLANDHAANGGWLTVVAVGTPAHGLTDISGRVVHYEPTATSPTLDYFTYTIVDGNGGTAEGLVTVAVGLPLTAPPVLTVSPSFLDFGEVPLDTTSDLVLTVTNSTNKSVPLGTFSVDQPAPTPFDATDPTDCVVRTVLPAGQSCTQTVRFWSVTGAGAASPGVLRIASPKAKTAALATVPLFASVGPALTSTNHPPVAADAVWYVPQAAPPYTVIDGHWSVSDPDHDILHIVYIFPPGVGTALPSPVPCDHNPNAECIAYSAPVFFSGVDTVSYLVADGRGGVAQAAIQVYVGVSVPTTLAASPFQNIVNYPLAASGPPLTFSTVLQGPFIPVHRPTGLVRYSVLGTPVCVPFPPPYIFDSCYIPAIDVGSAPLDPLGKAQLTLPFSALASDYSTVYACYDGDHFYAGGCSSVASVDQRVAKSSISLAASPNPVGPHYFASLTAAVQQAVDVGRGIVYPMPTGTVTFTDTTTGASFGAVGLDAMGQAVVQTIYYQSGPHTIQAAYSGDNYYSPMSATFIQDVYGP